jgi:hypothetical protein
MQEQVTHKVDGCAYGRLGDMDRVNNACHGFTSVPQPPIVVQFERERRVSDECGDPEHESLSTLIGRDMHR